MNENEVEYMGKTYVAVDCVGEGCVGCEFEDKLRMCIDSNTACIPPVRADKRDVIWILKENEHEAQ